MVDLNSVLEFSHTHCVTICAVLVPANLLATVHTLVCTGFNRPFFHRWVAIAMASVFALVMVLHVLTWFVVGVVMVPTYILLILGGVCLSLNLWAGLHSHSLRWCLQWIMTGGRRSLNILQNS
jgi:hypothetical protein